MKSHLGNNSNQDLLSPRRERIEVRGDMICTSTPTLASVASRTDLPRPKGEGIGESVFMVRG